MNTHMYHNPILQDNLEKCRHYGMEVLTPATGYLACGDTGEGKMPEPEALFAAIEHAVSYEKDLAGLHILVTAGPTVEAIDPVRFISNHSTGKMGYAIAKQCMLRGAAVTLVSGPTNLTPPPYLDFVPITSAKEMFDEVTKRAPMQDILAYLGAHKKKGQFLCGFSMETQQMLENSRAKLKKKNLDMIVANNLKVSGAGFAGDTNVVTLITQEGETALPLMSKDEVAEKLLDAIIKKQPWE